MAFKEERNNSAIHLGTFANLTPRHSLAPVNHRYAVGDLTRTNEKKTSALMVRNCFDRGQGDGFCLGMGIFRFRVRDSISGAN